MKREYFRYIVIEFNSEIDERGSTVYSARSDSIRALPMFLFWHKTGPAIHFDGEYLHVEDLNPEVETEWRMSRWELMVMGFKAIYAALRV